MARFLVSCLIAFFYSITAYAQSACTPNPPTGNFDHFGDLSADYVNTTQSARN